MTKAFTIDTLIEFLAIWGYEQWHIDDKTPGSLTITVEGSKIDKLREDLKIYRPLGVEIKISSFETPDNIFKEIIQCSQLL